MIQQKKVANLIPIDYPFESLVLKIDQKTLRLDPDFQRKYKWDKDGFERCSKFIESCLMRIPLPACYLAEGENKIGEGILDVIDGVQRLTTIYRFMHDEFALEGLTVYGELNGKRYSQLGKYKSELATTTIRCVVLRKENPRSIVQEIFARLNKGAVELSAQEIRHALYSGPFDDLLHRLSEDARIAHFKLSKNSQESTQRNNSREAEELVLRYFAFNVELTDYEDNASKWMDQIMDRLAESTPTSIAEMEAAFRLAIDNCEAVFGHDIFCNLANTKLRQSYAIYDVQMFCLGKLRPEVVAGHRNEIREGFKSLCARKDFLATLKVRLSSKSNIQVRRNMFMDVLVELGVHTI